MSDQGRLDIGGVIGETFRTYGAQAGLILGAAFVIFLPIAIIDGFIENEGGFLLSLVGSVISIVATYWFQGMVVQAVRDIQDGRRDFTLGALFSSVQNVVGTLIVVGILAGIGIAIGFVLIIIPGLILLTIWSVVGPAVVVDRTGVLGAFGRSRELVRGHGWAVFAVIVFFFIIIAIGHAIIAAIASGVSDTVVGYAVASLVGNLFLAPLGALAAAVLYFNLRRLHGEPEVPATAGYEPGRVEPSPGL
jgi:hypothetical protein